jgi:hypothetical protein
MIPSFFRWFGDKAKNDPKREERFPSLDNNGCMHDSRKNPREKNNKEEE